MLRPQATLCSKKSCLQALVSQLASDSEELHQVVSSILRNLSWRADISSKRVLRDIGCVSALMTCALQATKVTAHLAEDNTCMRKRNICFCGINGEDLGSWFCCAVCLTSWRKNLKAKCFLTFLNTQTVLAVFPLLVKLIRAVQGRTKPGWVSFPLKGKRSD